jgi:hypothetical protein
MSYYMSSWITSEYMDHEVFDVLKHSGSITKDDHEVFDVLKHSGSITKDWHSMI